MDIHTHNLELLGRVSSTVINRLNYPKREAKRMTRTSALAAKLRPLLSFHDCEEVRQTCALALHTTGALYRDKRHRLKLSDWLACFRSCRAVLRIDRKLREDATDIATLHEVPQIVAEPDKFTARRCAIARRIRYYRACITLAFAADQKRQRRHNRDKARRFLRFLASQASATGLGQAELTTAAHLWDTTAAFRRYVGSGEAILEREAAEAIAQRNAHLPPRKLRSFDQIRVTRSRKLAIAA